MIVKDTAFLSDSFRSDRYYNRSSRTIHDTLKADINNGHGFSPGNDTVMQLLPTKDYPLATTLSNAKSHRTATMMTITTLKTTTTAI